jgi:hypothetical protein
MRKLRPIKGKYWLKVMSAQVLGLLPAPPCLLTITAWSRAGRRGQDRMTVA